LNDEELTKKEFKNKIKKKKKIIIDGKEIEISEESISAIVRETKEK
jgi:hypothetical protein